MSTTDRRHLTLLKKYLSNCKYIEIIVSFIIQFIKAKHVSLGLLNAGSLHTRHDEFLVALERHAVDILAVNETWLREGEDALAPSPRGYRLRHIPRPKGRFSRGGGVGFYLRRGIAARPLHHPHT